ncbi:hypothetical protein PITC_018030 [Penicillium italicum]|uniref:Protein kinase domain-containing protein n=1 Tax=Penicillium italicum TaxID=40296 RepID=A0A0A2LAZ2_PENIT|nr:hypothetical protein PITC_018030 [Penicillium italicum]
MSPVELNEPVEYDDDAIIPFEPAGKSPVRGYAVEKVTPNGQRHGPEYARKTVFLNVPRDKENNAEKWRIEGIKMPGRSGGRFAIIMDLAYENLSHYSRSGPKINAKWFSCLLAGVNHLHQTLNMVHGAIKPTNILVKGGQVILTDIGCFSQRGVGVMIKRRSRENPEREYWASEAVDTGEKSKQAFVHPQEAMQMTHAYLPQGF